MICQRKTALMAISLPSDGGKWLQFIDFLSYLNHIKFCKLILSYLIKTSAFCKKDTIYLLQRKAAENTTLTKYWLYQYVISSLSQMLITLELKKRFRHKCTSKWNKKGKYLQNIFAYPFLCVFNFGWAEIKHFWLIPLFWKARSKMDRLVAASSWKLISH